MINKNQSIPASSVFMKMGLQSFASLLTRGVFGRLVLFAMLVSSTTKVFPQTVWTKDTLNNPVMDVGLPGSWDDVGIQASRVLLDDTTYHMWYEGWGGIGSRIGHATSFDRVNWTKDSLNNPVLYVGPPGSWDEYGVGGHFVLFDGAIYHMWYNGYDGSNWRIGYATSPDGVTWTKYTNNPVLPLGQAGSWDDYHVASSSVRFDGTTYHMWYSGYDGSNWRIGYATAPDETTWTKHTSNPVFDVGPPGSWDDYHVVVPSVRFDGTIYQMWYSGGDEPWWYAFAIGYVTAPDETTWTRVLNDPVLDVGPPGSWDDYGVYFPCVVFDDTIYHMWYTGNDGIRSRIGYATSTPTGIDENNPTDLPGGFALSQNYPNPFSPSTRISYSIPNSGFITLKVYNILGGEIQTLVSAFQEPGTYSVNFDTGKLSSGIYFYRLQVGSDFVETRKMLLMR